MFIIQEKVTDFEKNLKLWSRLIVEKEYYFNREIEAEIAREEAKLSRVSSNLCLTEEISIIIRERQKTLAKKKEQAEDIRRLSNSLSSASLDDKPIIEMVENEEWESKDVEVLESDTENERFNIIVGNSRNTILMIFLVLLLFGLVVAIILFLAKKE